MTTKTMVALTMVTVDASTLTAPLTWPFEENVTIMNNEKVLTSSSSHTHTHTHARTHTHTHARTHAHTYTHTLTKIKTPTGSHIVELSGGDPHT